MTSGCTEFREIAWDAMVCVYTDGQDRSRHLSLGWLALLFSGGATLFRKHGDCSVPAAGRAG